MANEITASASLAAAKGSTSLTLASGTLQIDLTGTNMIQNRVSVGTTEEAIPLSEVAAGGYFMAINRDATNFVSIRQATAASDLVRLDPGEFACFRLDDDATAPFWIADTAACEVEYLLLDD